MLFNIKQSIIDHILNDSFEDGLYDGGPGSHCVYPTKHKYDDRHEELGLIDCRRKANIPFEKVQSKSASVKK